MKKKIIYIGMVALMSYYTTQGQERGIYVTPHFSKTYQHSDRFGAEAVMGNGFNVGLSYGRYLSERFSIHLEPGYSQYHTKSKINEITGELATVDRDFDAFILRYQGKNLKEKITMKQFIIPLLLQYESKGEKTRFFVRSGVSYAVHFEKADSRTSFESLRTSGYYSEYGLELFEPEFVGFGNFDGDERGNKLDLKNRWAYIAEIGVKKYFEEDRALYIGVYLDIGLNNLMRVDGVRGEQPEGIIGYDKDLAQPLIVNSALQTTFDKAVYKNYNIGIKLKYAVKARKKVKEQVIEEVSEELL